MKKLIAGNWKMHGNFDMAMAFDQAMADAVNTYNHVDWLVCAPFPYIPSFENVYRGAQDCSSYDSGAYTGEVAASMLLDIGCDYCIVGHSERRAIHGETNEVVKAKATQVINNNITAIICVGETESERDAGDQYNVVEKQINESMPDNCDEESIVIAYEPVWAIGTGKSANAEDVLKMHGFIRDLLKTRLASGEKLRILYGGSVKPSNASELMNLDNVDGALIGGASLKSDDFIAIGAAVNK